MATVYLEKDWVERPMRERLRAAIDRLSLMENYDRLDGSVHSLRPEQVNVFADFVKYLERSLESGVGFGRIILPPRTGKTVIAGQFICATGLTALFLVPTRPLVEQVRKEFAQQIPGISLGVYYSAEKTLVEHGINVMTYHSFVSLFEAGILPLCVCRSALIFADEGHHAMTELRLKALREAFDPHARCVALTASPKYSEQHYLGQYYPELIHEITLPEALQMNLLAKYKKVLMHEVELSAENVKLVSGDFESRSLGDVLSHPAMLEFVRQLRYDEPEERERGCLIACASREHAIKLHQYLQQRRPQGASEPGLVLQDTPAKKRMSLLADFDEGKIDTLVQIGILVEGWSAVRCKMLIDIVPSISEVRALQKMFRPLTKWQGMQAIMHVLIPKGLPRKPILPDTMLLADEKEDALHARAVPGGKSQLPPRGKNLKRFQVIEGVKIRTRLLMEVTLGAPILDATNDDDIREVIATASNFDPASPPQRDAFLMLTFTHPLFRGSGRALLRHLGLPSTATAYRGLLLRLYLHVLPERALRDYHDQAEFVTCTDDARVLTELMRRFSRQPSALSERYRADFIDAWRTMFGGDEHDELPLEEWVFIKARKENTHRLLRKLGWQEERALRMTFGMSEHREELILKEIGAEFNVGQERARQIQAKALRKTRVQWRLNFCHTITPP